MKRPTKSYEIALSALAAAVAAVALTVGSYVDVLFAAGYLVAIFALMIPLSAGFVRGGFLAFLASWLLAFLFCGFAIFRLLPFIAFFGLHPLANYLQKKFVKKRWLHIPIFFGKAAWFDLSMWLLWAAVLVPFFGVESATWYPFVTRYFVWVLVLGGTVFFAGYDFLIFLCQRSADAAMARIRR